MCYNASSSITSYTYVTLLAIIVYLYGDAYDKHVRYLANLTLLGMSDFCVVGPI